MAFPTSTYEHYVSSRMETILDAIINIPSSQEKRPIVCLTWAQSLDGKLSASRTSPTLISGPQTLQLTHSLRAHHDAIMVGIGTLLCDNPRLTTRLVSDTSPPPSNPIPVLLDTHLRTPPSARCLAPRIHRPIIFCAPNAIASPTLCAVADVLPTKISGSAVPVRLDLQDVLMQLAERGVRTLMVEGGASLISSFLDAGLWDVAVITVAPVVFRTGVSLDTAPDLQTVDMSRFSKPQWTQVGGDVVMLGFPK